MARASVSWVLQRYKDGPEAEYVRFTANGRTTTKRLNEATQFARRINDRCRRRIRTNAQQAFNHRTIILCAFNRFTIDGRANARFALRGPSFAQ